LIAYNCASLLREKGNIFWVGGEKKDKKEIDSLGEFG
jgi:hypothetical protein